MSYCICVSGNIGFLVLSYLWNKNLNIEFVLTDSNSNDIINFCKSHNIAFYKGNPRNGKAFNDIYSRDLSIDVLLSVNYLFIIEKDLIDLPKKYAINVHGSLLPRYRGRCPNVWAIINGEKEYGVTAHLISEGCDEGDIVKQLTIPIDEDITGAELLHNENLLYPKWIYDLTIEIEVENIVGIPQNQSKATYFGKRTPDDGQIDWNWQKERIKNWVRAQANPYYPGAFSFINGKKIIINKISYSDLGYSWDLPNGLVIDVQTAGPLVKTQNGVVILEDYIFENTIEKGYILK